MSAAPPDSLGGYRAQAVAFYLPQYHPIPENDRWWGAGFTEWTNVRRAEPCFEGHRQPRIPTVAGYYDLRDVDVYHLQQELARQYGIGAFCYYAYWFTGRRLLERPLEVISSHPDLTLPYCICWANENWTRAWDGLDKQILMPQQHSVESDAKLIDDLAVHLTDPRYLRVDGAPLLLVYRAAQLDDPSRTADAMRQRASDLGIGDLHLAMVQSMGAWDPRGLGFDSAVEFPPHNGDSRLFRLRPDDPAYPADIDSSPWRGALCSYRAVVEWAMSKPVPEFTWFRGVMPGWDNTPRRGREGTVFLDDDATTFQMWLERALHYTYLFCPPDRRLIFINAWNEWAEGAYLEPDVDTGFETLEAVARALVQTDELAISTAEAHRCDSELLLAAQTYFRSAAFLSREVLAQWSSV